MLLRCLILIGVTISTSACGSISDSSYEPITSTTRNLPAEQFDLLEVTFPNSSVTLNVGARAEVTVEVRQQKDEQLICGLPLLKDPFGNVLAALQPRQESQKTSPQQYLYHSRFAFYAAASGDYSLEFENRECTLAALPATATVKWLIEGISLQ